MRNIGWLIPVSCAVVAVGCTGEGGGAVVVEPLRCQGNEPFWNLTIEDSEARYSALTEFGSERTFSGRYTGDPGLREWSGTESLNPENRLVAVIAEETCLDTMSDETPPFSHSIRLTLPDGNEVNGCCREHDPATNPDPGLGRDLPVADLESEGPAAWSRFLLELLPAIDTCLAATDGSAPRVTKAWPMNRGMVGVRLRNAEGGWFHCVAPSEGGAVDRHDLLDHRNKPLPDEGLTVYTPAVGAPPAGNCYEHEQVLDGSGNRIGWLSYNRC